MSVLTIPKGWSKVPEPFRGQLSNSTLNELARLPPDWPELEILPLAAPSVSVNDTGNYITISLIGLTTTSRGNVTINTTDTNQNPIVSPNWLTTQTDQEIVIAGLKLARQLASKIDIVIPPAKIAPGASIQSDAQILEFIKKTLAPIHHAVGTCE